MLKPSCKRNFFLTILLIALFLLASNSTNIILASITERQTVTQGTEFISDTKIDNSCCLQDIEDGSITYISESNPIYDQSMSDFLNLDLCHGISKGEGVTILVIDTPVDYRHDIFSQEDLLFICFNKLNFLFTS